MKRVLPWMITMLLAITLIVLVFFMIWNSQNSPSSNDASAGSEVQMKRLSADEILELTSVMSDIKTNLSSQDYVVQIGLSFQMDTTDTKEEFEKIKDIMIKPVVLKTLADMSPEDLKGKLGQDQLAAKLLEEINKTMPKGKVIQVDVVDLITMRI